MHVLSTLFASAVRLRCPACHKGPLFDGFFKVNPRCVVCGQTFSMAPGEFTGGVYLNYALTAVLVGLLYLVLERTMTLSVWVLTAILAVTGGLLPFLFLRNTRAAFMAVLYLSGALQDHPEERKER